MKDIIQRQQTLDKQYVNNKINIYINIYFVTLFLYFHFEIEVEDLVVLSFLFSFFQFLFSLPHAIFLNFSVLCLPSPKKSSEIRNEKKAVSIISMRSKKLNAKINK